MSDILGSNVLVLSKKGKLLAIHEIKEFIQVRELLTEDMGTFIDEKLNDRLLNILSTKENINLETLGFTNEVTTNKIVGMVVPIDIAGERLGTLFLYRQTKNYHIEDIILGEYGATVVGLEIMRSINDENSEETRKTAIVKSAIGTLSFSEQEAIKHIFNELSGNEGILVASKIADKVGITRSVIVNALRKFESAGVIESRSLGMKGTYIKILNELLIDELNKI
jgi:GTP-sensing transcriptional pleiotropic repressor CodY